MDCNHERVVILAQAEINADLHPGGRIEVDEAAGTLKVEWLFCTECKHKIEPTQDQVTDILKALSFADDGFVI